MATTEKQGRGPGLTPGDDSPFMAPAQVADYLGVSERTLREMRSDRTGPPFSVVGPHTLRYRRDDVDDWMRERLETPAGRRRKR